MTIVKKLALGLALTGLLAPALRADDYPSRPVRIIVGFGPGASADITARVLAQRFNQKLGQQFVVENRPGAGSSLAAEFVARAPKDGYTLFMATIANTINSAISANLNFDFAKDLAPIALIATVPNILVVHPSLGVNSVRDLIALAKSKPEQITYGSSGVGTLTHVSVELFNSVAGVKFVHVPYPGSAQAVADLLAGRIQVSWRSRRLRSSARASRRTCRPWRKRVCRASRPGCGSACSRRPARRGRSSTSSPPPPTRRCRRAR
jgi:tripartite-type tricarboxylate transporter receptor subunit TctC